MKIKCEGCGHEFPPAETLFEVGMQWYYCLSCVTPMTAKKARSILDEPVPYAIA